jgi:WD40 repeat protein
MVTKGSWIGPLKSSAGCCLLALALVPETVFAQSPAIIWQQSTNSDRINTVVFSHDGSTLYSGSSDRLINIWNAGNGALLGVLDAGAPEVHPSSIEALAISPDSSKLVSVNYQQIKIWQLPGGALQTINGHSDWVVDCAFHPNGSMFATASFDTTVKVWNSSGGLLKTFTTPGQQRTVAFSPDGTYLASAGGDDLITIHRVSDWATVGVFHGHTDSIYALAWSPDGTLIASGGYDQVLRVWNVANGTQRFTVGNNHGNIYGVAFSPDGATIAYTDGEGNTLRLVRVSDGALTTTYTTAVDNVQCVAFSPQGTLAYGRVDETVVVANVSGQGTTTGPAITLTSPHNGATYTAPANVSLSAAASAGSGIARVKFYVNSTLVATTTTPPYNASITLNNGTYNVQAAAVAQDGRVAASSVATIAVGNPSSPTSRITVGVNGAGTVSPNYNGQVIANGNAISMTATPAPNWVFSGWSGTISSSAQTISFVVQQDTAVQANFTASPFTRVSGQYCGLIQSDPVDIDHVGNFRIAVQPTGVFSATFRLGTQLYQLVGKFKLDGSYSGSAQGGNSIVSVDLQLPISDNSDQISGTISDGTTSANVSADRYVWNPVTRPAPAGVYSVMIPGGSGSGEPNGAGIGFATVNSSGLVFFSGNMSDWTPVACITYLAKNRSWPLFLRGGGTDTLIGQVQIEDIPGQSDMDGNITWMRRPSNGRFSAGFSMNTSFLASSIITSPPPGINSLLIPPAANNVSVTIGGADTASDTVFDATLTGGNQLIPDSFGSGFGLQLSFHPNGLVSGQFFHPDTAQLIGFAGIIFQKQHMAAGFWLRGPEMSGYITVQQGGQGDSGGNSTSSTSQSTPTDTTPPPVISPDPAPGDGGHKHGKG